MGRGIEEEANVSLSFGAFFILRLARLPGGASGWAVAAYALLGVWGQELAQLLGLYPGTFDLRDLLFDGVGVGVALVVHAALRREGSEKRR